MFKRKGGGGQRPIEQCSKKLHFSLMAASLIDDDDDDDDPAAALVAARLKVHWPVT